MGLELLREMQAQGVRPNTVTYSTLLDLLTDAGQWQRALHMFMTLEKEGVARTVWLYTAAIRACARGQQLDTALALLREVTSSPSLRADVNLCLYTAALDACEKVGNGSLALQLLDEMHREHGLVVDAVACGVVISACRKAGLVGDCLRLLAFMLNHRLAPNLGVYNTVLGALCSQPEFLDKAVEVLAYLQEGSKRAERAGAGAAGKRGHRHAGEAALPVPKPNAQSYAQVVNALADALRWEEALRLLKGMRKAGHRPEVLTCAKVVAACERRQRWKEALQLLDEMRKDDYDFYELELLDAVFKKLVGVAAAGVRSLTAPASAGVAATGAVAAGADGEEEEEEEEEEDDGEEDDDGGGGSSGARRLLGESEPIAAGVGFAAPAERVR
jgi:pentatricopeptide repeat protein